MERTVQLAKLSADRDLFVLK